jgi:hypothetical protein
MFIFWCIELVYASGSDCPGLTLLQTTSYVKILAVGESILSLNGLMHFKIVFNTRPLLLSWSRLWAQAPLQEIELDTRT